MAVLSILANPPESRETSLARAEDGVPGEFLWAKGATLVGRPIVMAWAAGTRVGSYEIVDVLGGGGMGQVFRVRHLISDRVEAMKVLLSASAANQETIDRFTREIRVLAGLSHP